MALQKLHHRTGLQLVSNSATGSVTRIFGRYVAPRSSTRSSQSARKPETGRNQAPHYHFIYRSGVLRPFRKTPGRCGSRWNEHFDIVTRCIFENKELSTIDVTRTVLSMRPRPEDHPLWQKAAQAITREGAALQKKFLRCGCYPAFRHRSIPAMPLWGISEQKPHGLYGYRDAVNLAARLNPTPNPARSWSVKRFTKRLPGVSLWNPWEKSLSRGKANP